MKPKHIMLAFTVWLWSLVWRTERENANETPIENKVVLITGASSGIGWAAAHAFAKAGAHVILVARRANLLAALQEELAQYGNRVLTVAGDVTSDEEMQVVFDEAMNEFGRIDILVNNAGVVAGGYLEDIDSKMIHKMIEINLFGAIRLTQMVLPIMKEQNSGHIVNITSASGITHAPGTQVYGATKSGLIAFSKSLQREVASFGIRVSTVNPAWTETEMIDRMSDTDLLKDDFFVRILSTEEVAEAIVDAVRYNRFSTVMGGLGFHIAGILERIHPSFASAFYQVEGERFIKGMEKLG